MRIIPLVTAALLAVGDVMASQPGTNAVTPKSPSKIVATPTTSKAFPTFATNTVPAAPPPVPTLASSPANAQNVTAATSTSASEPGPTSGSTSGTVGVAIDPLPGVMGMAVMTIVLGFL
ncbi:hypothetical protein V8B97DRAFT_169577 [Scleroderma yunnanense]